MNEFNETYSHVTFFMMQGGIVKSKCVICYKITTKKCLKCNRTYYCSEDCQQRDPDHKHICYQALSDVFSSIFDLHQVISEKKCSCRYRFDDSYQLSSFRHKILFADYRCKLYVTSRGENLCIVCGQYVDYGSQSVVELSFVKDGQKFHGYECYSCHRSKLTICVTTFKDTRKCFSVNVITLLLSLRSSDYTQCIPPDVIKLIMQTCNKAKCC